MKKPIQLIFIIGRCCLFGFFLQASFMSLLHAMPSNSKSPHDIREVILSVSLEDVPLSEVFAAIQEQTDFSFFYEKVIIAKTGAVSIDAQDKSMEEILLLLAKEYYLSFKQVNERISVKEAVRLKDTQSITVEQTITGTVTDQSGEPLPGVTVSVPGTAIGTATDLDGRYLLSVPEGSTLVFSFIGFESQNIAIGDRSVIDVVLNEDIASLDEVVVVGYGTQKKESVVGAIETATGETLARGGYTTNLAQALTGRLPGVTVVSSTGEPGADDPSIFIRGMGTWNNAQPLILVDGIERRMNDIDVSEVETVSVLKDASATAVFGVKGAEGVILITTKRGRVGKPVVTADVNVTTKTISRVAEKMNSYDQFRFRNDVVEYQLNRISDQRWESYVPERMLQYYKQPQPNGLQYLFPDVDWPKELTKEFPISYRTSVNISGGTEFAKYFGSVTYNFDDDMIRSDADPMNRGYKAQNSYERINFRTNLDLNLTRNTVFSINLAGWIGNKRNGYGSNFSSSNIFRAFGQTSPDQHPMLMHDGSYGFNPIIPPNSGPSPLRAANNSGVQSSRQTNVTTDFILKQKLDFVTKGLSTRLSFSYDNSFFTAGGITDGGSRQLYISPDAIDILYTVNGSYIDENGNFYVKEGHRLEDYMDGYIFNQATNNDFDWAVGTPSYVAETSSSNLSRRMFYQAQLNYERSFDQHNVSALALVNREQYASGSMFPRYREDWVGRVTYNFDERYLFESNFAYNGSERFGSEYRFGFFPSAAIGWMLTEEKFMGNIGWLNDLKLRYSIGRIGNDSFSAPRWAYQTNWALDADRTIFGYPGRSTSPYHQYYEVVIGNPNLHWEVASKQNLGIEIGLLNNRINLNADFFMDKRSDIFLSAGDRTIPTYFGQSAVSANLGETLVKGYELDLSLKNTFPGGLYTYLNITYTGAFDEIIHMEDPPLLPDHKKNAGYPINQIRTQIDAGYINNWDDAYSATGFATGNTTRMPGDYRILDFDGNGMLDANDAAPYSYPQDRPQHTYGLNLGGDYKGFGMMLQFYGIYNVTRENTHQMFPFGNLTQTGPALAEFANNSWTPNNTDADYRATLIYMANAQSLGAFRYIDGSFLRLKTAEISYTVARPFLSVLGVNSAKVYLNGNNLFLWSKMIDDREGASAGEVYPLVKRFNLGVNVKF